MSLKASVTYEYNTVHNVKLFKLQTLLSERVVLNILKMHYVVSGEETVFVFMTD